VVILYRSVYNEDSVFNGDLVTGENLLAENATVYQDLEWEPTVKRKIPFSCTYGNHDNSVNWVELSVCSDSEVLGLMTGLLAFIGIFRVSYSSTSLTNKRSITNTSSISVEARIACRTPDRTSDQAHVPIYVDEQQVIPSVIMWFFDFQGFTPGLGETSGDAQTCWVDQEVLGYVRGQMRRMKERREKVPLALVFMQYHLMVSPRLDQVEPGIDRV
jgi:hypothetical protein